MAGYLKSRLVWYPTRRFLQRKQGVPDDLLFWLLNNDSLTVQLMKACQGQFGVKVLDQAWQRPYEHERAKLRMRSAELGFVRHVHLMCDGVPWVFARTVIPMRTLKGRLKRLTMLGTRPLGAVLFADPNLQRQGVEIARVGERSALYQQARQQHNDGQAIWGRRSLFKLERKLILVSELFLPDIGKCE